MLFRSRIDALIRKHLCNGYDEYLQILKKDQKILEDFKAYLTINVTEFFRNPSQWSILEEHIFPTLLDKKRTLKIWSAACSTGDEPYSLAMVLSKIIPLNQIQILATDIDKEVLAKAQEGIYNSRNMINMPKTFKDMYIKEENGNFYISDQIKKCITFKQHNLLKDPYPKGIDLIVCRNVLIYFTEDAKKEIYHKFNEALVEEGILFVGSTEQIIMCQEYGFEPNKIFFYQKAISKK